MEQGYVFSKFNEKGGVNTQYIMLLPFSHKYAFRAALWEDKIYDSKVFDTYEDAVSFLQAEGFENVLTWNKNKKG